MIPWPSTDQTVQCFVEPFLRRCEMIEKAALAIQLWYRACKAGKAGRKGAWTGLAKAVAERAAAVDDVLDTVVSVSPKFDGTNVGLEYGPGSFASLVGRRLMIHSAEKLSTDEKLVYQKIDVRPLMEHGRAMPSPVDVLCADLGHDFRNRTRAVSIHGELMCNREKYPGYPALYGMFAPFGMQIKVRDVQHTLAITRALNEVGFRARVTTKDPEDGQIQVVYNPALERFFERCGLYNESDAVVVRVPQRVMTFFDLVSASEEARWVHEHVHEGVVVVPVSHEIKHGKWKNASEPQSKNITVLRKAIDYANNHPSAPFHDPRWTQVIEILLAAATNAKDKRGDPEARMIEQAFHSAQTKFDAPEKYFEHDDREAYIDLIVAEIVGDPDCTVSSRKKIVSFVKKRVGAAYGTWKARWDRTG